MIGFNEGFVIWGGELVRKGKKLRIIFYLWVLKWMVVWFLFEYFLWYFLDSLNRNFLEKGVGIRGRDLSFSIGIIYWLWNFG